MQVGPGHPEAGNGRAANRASDARICLLCEGISATRSRVCSSCGTPLVAIDAVHFPLRRGEEESNSPFLGHLVDGKYRITGMVGKGGMGTVFRAVHRVSLVPVALKILHPRLASDPVHRRTFLAEARKAGRVVHENSARILDVGECDDGTVYLVIELVEGTTLHERIYSEPPLTPPQVAVILYQIASALHEAHRSGVVHSDLTPRNVMLLVRDGRPFVKILDFGIARMAAEARVDASSVSGRFANPPYSAPEHLAGQPTDPRADLYSLGVIAYEALSRTLPVEGADRREQAQRTIEGRLRPLPSLPGVPPALQRLVQQMLATDPARRPASAAEVLGALVRILQPQATRLRVASMFLALVGAVAVAFTYLERSPPMLESQGDVLVLEPVHLGPVQELRTERLQPLRLSYSGFVPSRLSLEVTQGPEVRIPFSDLAPRVDVARGLLELSGEASATYLSVLSTLASLSNSGPVGLEFFVGGRSLGQARLRIDDEPPAVHATPSEQATAVFRSASYVDLQVTDSGTIESVVAVLTQGGEPLARVPLRPDQRRIEAPQLREHFPLPTGTANVELRIEAKDRAGNVGQSDRITFDQVDLCTPVALSYESPTAPHFRYGPDGAKLLVKLDKPEAEVLLQVRPPGGEAIQLEPIGGAGTNLLEFMIPARPADGEHAAAFPAGTWEFTLCDRQRNTDRLHKQVIAWQSEDLQHAFAVDRTRPSIATLAADSFVLGEDAQIGFTCNPIYEPRALRLRAAGAGPVSAAWVRLQDAAPGRCTIDVRGLPAGSYEFELELGEAGGPSPLHRIPLRLVSLPQPPQLDLPDVRGARFLPELIRAGLLREVDGKIASGTSWQLEPPEFGLLHGRIWTGSEQNPVATAIDGERPDPRRLIQDLQPLPGENLLGVELRDPLGRPVTVRVGGQPTPRPEPNSAIAIVARFHYQPKLAELLAGELRIEHGQPVRVTFTSALPFTPTDAVELILDDLPIRADRIRRFGDRTELRFTVPFDRIAAAARWVGMTRDELLKQPRESLPARIQTPAGTQTLELPATAIRSQLAPLKLGELPERSPRLPRPLERLEFVPVHDPGSLALPDPVPDGITARGLYRPGQAVAVRNVETFFLLRTELTRAQYWSAVEAFCAREAPADARRFVHACDPLGPRRLRRESLLPAAWQQTPQQFHELLARAPDRPVTGIDFFQAWTVARICGELAGGQPELLRLPFGIEMEWAALGAARDRFRGNAAAQAGYSFAAWRGAQQAFGDFARWPPTAAEQQQHGDHVEIGDGIVIYGLDFGVREWVSDLPVLRDEGSIRLLGEWTADYVRHRDRTRALAAGTLGAPALLPQLERLGVLRGTASGEPQAWIDGASGAPLQAKSGEPVPETVPGVVRVLQLRRDGRGLLASETDPHLVLAGMRLAGGPEFVARVRER